MTQVYTNYDFLGVNRVLGLPTTPRTLDEAPSIGYVLSLLSDPTVIGKPTTYAPVLAAKTSNQALSGTATANASGKYTLTIDGVELTSGRVLLAGQTSAPANGIYNLTINQSNGAYSFTRATDADAAAEFVQGNDVLVLSGTSNGRKVWALTSASVSVLGTDAIVFEVSTSAINDNAGGSTVGKYATNITSDGATLEYEVTHSLNSTDIVVSVKKDGAVVQADIVEVMSLGNPDPDKVKIVLSTPVANGEIFRVVVVG